MDYFKSPGKTRKHCCGNICDFRCFLKCFPVCPPKETLLRKQNFLPRKKNVSYKIQKHLMFPKCDCFCGNIVSLFAHMFPARKHFFQIRACAKTNNTKKWLKVRMSQQLLQTNKAIKKVKSE